MSKTHRRTPITIAAPVLAAALLISGCSGGSSTAGSSEVNAETILNVSDEQLQGTNIKLARFFGNCSAEVGDNTDLSKVTGECPTIQTLTNKFNAENEWGITVENQGGAAWTSYYDSLNTAIAGGDAPDVAIMHGSSLVDYASRGLLLPVDDLAEITGINLDDAVPAAKTAITYEGASYGIPFDVHAALAHVNVDLFKKAGLLNDDGTPKLPSSPEEFLKDAKKMKEATGKDYFAVARSGDQLGVHLFETLLNQQGSGVISDDKTEATIDTPEARTALSFMEEVFSKGYADGNQTYDAAQQSFLRGNAAMLFNGTWVVDQYNETAPFEYVAANFPTLYSEPSVWADSHMWTIPKQEDADPAKYRAAIEFASFLYEHDAAWALKTGHIAARESVLKSEEYKAAPQRGNYVQTGLSIAHSVPHVAGWPAIADTLVETIESVWFQDKAVDDALRDGDAKIDSLLK